MNRVGALLSLVVVTCMSLSGCQTPSNEAQDWPTIKPATLRAPTWRVGDNWHFSNSDGSWENWTVEAKETRRERPSYRISVDFSPPDDLGHYHSVVWRDVESLGLVEEVFDDGVGVYGSPGSQVFPLVNRSYESTSHYSWGSTETTTIDSTVKGWVKTATPAGVFWAVELHTIDRELDNDLEHAWYSPEVGNFVRHDPYADFRLVSWHRA